MTKKLILLLLLLSASTYGHTPTRRHRAALVEPDMTVSPVAIQRCMDEVLATLSPLERTVAMGHGLQRVKDLLEVAYGKLGSRYRRGSMGPNAFDCSGFTGFVFRQLGIILKRSSQEQHTQGRVIEKVADLLPGDLVFFGHGGRRGRRVNHVGIVTDVQPDRGTFDFIHSSTSQGVVINHSTDHYWSTRFISGRRMLEDPSPKDGESLTSSPLTEW